VAPLTLLTLAIFVAMLAIVFDGGALMAERGHAHAVADAAALAAAADLFTYWSTNAGQDPKGTALASALSVAAANGYANDGVTSTVTVTFAPNKYQGGPSAGTTISDGHVEVIVQYNFSGNFCSLLQQGTPKVAARSVARGMLAPLPDGLVLLNLSASKALNLSNSAQLVIKNTAVQANSSSTDALDLSGSATVSATGYSLVSGSGYQTSGSATLTGPSNASPTVSYGTTLPDPLRYLAAPDPNAPGVRTQGTNLTISSGTVELYPGVYNGGIQINGTAQVHLHSRDGAPGIFYLKGGGLKISNSATVTMAASAVHGVMIYNDWQSSSDQISVSGSASLTLNPHTVGPYAGLSIFQARGTPQTAAPTISFGGSGSLNVSGTVYAPYANANLSGTAATVTAGGQYIVDSFTASNSGTINIDRQSKPVAGVRMVGIVE
jgi:hypothetical protein